MYLDMYLENILMNLVYGVKRIDLWLVNSVLCGTISQFIKADLKKS